MKHIVLVIGVMIFRPDYKRIVNILKQIPENTPILAQLPLQMIELLKTSEVKLAVF